MRKMVIVAILGLLLGGCATRGALDISCPEFPTLRHDLPYSQLEREIHGEGGIRAEAVEAEDDLTRRLDRALAAQQPLTATRGGAPAVLLLSGGGQWGAFGAGFLDQMRQDGALPQFSFITGVSTGSLQSLFVSVDTPAAWQGLLAAYDPAKESDVVDRNPKWEAVFTGSFAGLGPLRRRIENALCPDSAIDDPNAPCMIDALRALQGRKSVLIGFVHGASGAFQYADAVEIAAKLPRREARTCLAGAALASAAMPVTFQQVRINGETYYDGGTRLSVFEASLGASVRKLAARRRAAAGADAALPVYVVRNGPTMVQPDPAVDRKADALTAAERAEAIVVNQLEVGSIAAIRIEHPSGPLNLVTADGWDSKAGCVKPGDAMFDKGFMNCLTAYGRTRARATPPWIALSEVGPEGPAPAR